MTLRTLRLIGALAVMICVVGGCRDASLREGEHAVRQYCDALIVAYRTSDTTPLRGVATEKELTKITALIDIKKAAGLVLENTLEELRVSEVAKPGPGLMVVATTERWRYFDRSPDVGQAPGTEFVAEIDLEYTFIKDNGTWLMDQARTIRHDYLEPEGYSHMQDDPHGAAHGEGL